MFEGFTVYDFNAFQSHKWKSDTFNKERLNVRRKLGRLRDDLKKLVREDAIEKLEPTLSLSFPKEYNGFCVDSLLLYYSRLKSERKSLVNKLGQDFDDEFSTHYRHINLSVMIRYEGVEVALRINNKAWIDQQNMIRKCKERKKIKEFILLLLNIGDYYLTNNLATKNITEEKLLKLFDELNYGADWFIIGQWFSKKEKILYSPEFAFCVSEIFNDLYPIYNFIAWSPSNDWIF